MRHSKTTLFLMELIISILFFALSSAVCVQLFVKAHMISNHSTQANQAVLWAENVAELFDRYDADASAIIQVLAEENIPSNLTYNITPANSFDMLPFSGLQIFFDKDFQPVLSDAEDVCFRLNLEIEEGDLYRGTITVSRIQSTMSSEKELYSLTVDKYMQSRRLR